MLKPEQWMQIEVEARACPVLRRYVASLDHQRSDGHPHTTREEALVSAAIRLSRERREVQATWKDQWDLLDEENKDAHCPVVAAALVKGMTSYEAGVDALFAAVRELSMMRREMIAERQRTMNVMLRGAAPGIAPALLNS
jgi:hypothetical protein